MESLSQRGEKEIGMGEGGCGLCEGINEEDGGEKKDNEGALRVIRRGRNIFKMRKKGMTTKVIGGLGHCH